MLDARGEARLNIMPVASWEFWAVANMLITTHGDDAEMKAQLSLEAARQADDIGGTVTWTEVIKKLAEMRSENQTGREK